MADLNRVTLLGRLGKDPEMGTTQSGEKVANFSIATGEQWKDKATGEKKERTEWHNVVVWGALAGVAERFLTKGSRVYIEGAQRTRKWQDQTGNDKWSTEVVLSGFSSRLDVIDWPEGSASGGAARGKDESYGGYNMQPSRQGDIDDDIPF